MKSSYDYFKKRAERRMDKAHMSATKYMHEMDMQMEATMKSLKQDIIDLMVKIDPNPNKARELLEQKIPNKEYEKMLELFHKTKDRGLRKELKQKLKTEALKSRISRKGALYSAIERKRIEMTDFQLNRAKTHLKRTILNTSQMKAQDYHRAFAFVDDDYVNRILQSNWLGSNYSERIWSNQMQLAEALKESIVQQYITGKAPALIGRDLLVDGSKANAHRFNVARIMRTETSYMVNKTELEDAKRLGITKRKFVATIDSRTSKVCSEHNGNIIPIDECVIGKNVPPLHPFCRSFMIDYIPGLSDDTEWSEEAENNKNLPPIVFDDADIGKYRNYIEKEIPNYQKDNVVLFKERLKHIEQRHKDLGDIEKIVKSVVESPNYILTSKEPNTLQFIKSQIAENHAGNVIVKISTDDKQNSVITAMKIRKSRVEKLKTKYKIVYKK